MPTLPSPPLPKTDTTSSLPGNLNDDDDGLPTFNYQDDDVIFNLNQGEPLAQTPSPTYPMARFTEFPCFDNISYCGSMSLVDSSDIAAFHASSESDTYFPSE